MILIQRKVSVIKQNLLNALIIGINSFLVDFICNDFKEEKKDTEKNKIFKMLGLHITSWYNIELKYLLK